MTFGGTRGTKCVRAVPSLSSLGPSERSVEGSEARSARVVCRIEVPFSRLERQRIALVRPYGREVREGCVELGLQGAVLGAS